MILAIAGGSGSGKTTFANKLKTRIGATHCRIISQDSYYFDRSEDFAGDGSVNFDHPSALDFDLMAEHLQQLKQGKSVELPQYDYKTHRRKKETTQVELAPVILVDGTLVLGHEKVRNYCEYKIFIDVPEELRFSRRLQRDVEQRGRQPEGVKRQFSLHVKPMHDEFVEPSKTFADFVIKDGNEFDRYLGELSELILLQKNSRAVS